MFQVDRHSASILSKSGLSQISHIWHLRPKLGIGSINCAGKENLTEAISETPINLESSSVSQVVEACTVASGSAPWWAGVCRRVSYFFKIPKNILSLEVSSGVLSTAELGTDRVGVEAAD